MQTAEPVPNRPDQQQCSAGDGRHGLGQAGPTAPLSGERMGTSAGHSTRGTQWLEMQPLLQAQQEGGKQSADHSSTVVENLRLRLKDTTKEFQDVLTLRTENLKAQTDRRSLFSAPVDKGRASRGGEAWPAAQAHVWSWSFVLPGANLSAVKGYPSLMLGSWR